jgi:hypothetical protein
VEINMQLHMSDENEQQPQPSERKPLRLPRLPRPGRPSEERRKQRSANVADALAMALDGAVDQGELDAVVVTDDFGMVVSSNHTELDIGMLAAVTPIVARGRAIARIKRSGERRDLSVRTVSVLGETLHVAALGGERASRQRGAALSAAAVSRILA